MKIFEKLAGSKLDDDVKVSVVIREAPPKPRDSLLVNPQQFEDQYSKLRIVFLSFLKSNKEWNGDFRNETKTE